LLVATYERQRDLYDTNNPSKMYGPGSGLYKTTDGGKTFKKLAKGLPTCSLGRMGIDYYRKNPNTIFLVLESEKNGTGPIVYLGIIGEDAAGKGAKLTQVTQGSPAEKAGLKAGDLVTAFGGKPIHSYDDLSREIIARKPDDKVKVKVTREGKDLE